MHIIINTKNAPQPIGPYVQGIKKNNIVIISGQIPINLNSKIISDDIIKQTKQVLNNIKIIIEKSGLKINNIVKTTIFVTNLNEIKKINLIYKEFFKKNNSEFPSRTCVEVNKLPKNAKIEIEAIAIN
ncbi:Rid family detoxifying hydrolase [Buchnera aphidicola]|uniref:Reactive intermediate/imine deaminase n=1 Tax=Buchnera aphidicola (Therioaphis trifolii) TaxID=1241884 RepID=A0A4D6YM89_9GAMM|nr:Rid family detoxifying hydrolase [Buchnera aphidicola]QCI27240.1 reactive intermediate/imine deaminase [Buchnera aphidicola (Therioaphis trifolii)]